VIRRVVNIVAVVGLVLASLFTVLTPASAAPTDPGGPCYPPGSAQFYAICHQAVITSSTTTPFAGQPIEAGGLDYFHSPTVTTELVKLTIGGIFVGIAHTDATGHFDPPVIVPKSLSGDQLLTGTGQQGTPNDTASLVLHIQAGVLGTTITNPGPNGGGTAFTGVRIALIVALAAVLLAGGVGLTMAGRRRHARHG
jgi:hypothetical protein